MDIKQELIYQSGDSWSYVVKEVNKKTFQIEYTEKGGFLTAADAGNAMEKDKIQFENDMKTLKHLANCDFTFGGYLNYWYQHVLQEYAFGSYQMGCAWVIYDLVIPSLEKDILLSMVNSSYINRVLKKIAPSCISAGHEARKIISLAMKDAAANGYISVNPMNSVDRYPEAVPEVVVYTKEQLKKLLADACGYHSVYLEILMGVFCGLRPGEVLGLKFSDFDFERNTVTVNRQITRNYEVKVEGGKSCRFYSGKRSIKNPKSFNSHRTLRVPEFIMDEVRERRRENDKVFEKYSENIEEWGDFLCINQKGTGKSDGTVLAALTRICTRNSLPKISAHGLRHIYAGILIEQGVPLEKISKLLGHKSVSTTFDVYCSIIHAKEHIREFVEVNLNPLNAIQNTGKEEEGNEQKNKKA